MVKKRHGLMKYILVVVVALAIVLGVKFLAGREAISYSVPVPAVTVALPVVGTMEESLTINGHVEARSMIPVIPLVSGTIVDYPAKAGEQVVAGQLLAQIDPEAFRQQMLQAQAAYTGFESSFKRVEGLYKAGAATQQEYDTVKAQRDAARAQYDLAVLQLGYASVSSPVAGTVLAAPLSAGSVAASPQPVAVVADLSDLVVRLQVPEKYFTLFSQYRHQLKAQIILPQDEVGLSLAGSEAETGDVKLAQGRLDTMAPYIDGSSKTFETVFQLEEGREWFTPGMFVRVRIVFNSLENVLLLPITARKMDGTLYFLEASEMKTDSEAAIQGRLSSWNHQDSVTDNQWIVVPDEYQTKLFVVEGQERVLAGQEVQAAVVELSWEQVQ
ncbi:MAG: efflux RND transporter periplasmic adaptor subunit [Treponema sp.]|nr:efflux RND transporter periplasmic adaptor subunit [Treponema sp.]MDY4674629.1 efflux RND transporter periplasmic adaptor subunit [Treponema sp.]